MGDITAALLELPTWRAFDVDDQGRVLAGSDATGSVQLVELAAGRTRELTALPGACRGRYLPGERAVVVEHDQGGDECTRLSLLLLDPPPAQPAGLAGLVTLVADPGYQNRLLEVLPGRIVYATNRRNGVDFDVVVRNVATGAEETVYAGGGYVGQIAVDAEARRLVVTVPGVPAMSDQLLVVDTMPATEDDRVRALSDAADPARYEHPQWSGEQILVSTDADRDLMGIAVIDPADGSRRWLATDDGIDLAGLLTPDGRTLLLLRAEDGVDRLVLHDAASGARRGEVELPGAGVISRPAPEPVLAPGSRYAALSFTAPGTPGDVVLLDLDDGTARVLTHSAAAWGGPTLVRPTSHRIPAPDGEQIPCFVYRPADPDGSAVLVLHGGPESQAVRSFSPVVQALIAAGHTVLVPNVRGSTGYGKRWYSADDVERRLDAVADLAALHDALPGLGCDPARAALWGASYGGYLVLAGLAFQPQRWAAGVDIVGMSSLVTFLENTSGYRRAHREREYGSLEQHRAFLEEASPLARVDDIRAPLVVIHGANDPRVPLSEAEQLTAALRGRGVPCELLVYPDEGHGLAKLPNRLDAYQRAIAFLGEALRARARK
ncbi:S9 family peptidase [Pseudonocardia acidicola]|uniref:S9 family peptidase n=1 Tax=Pseudonocardia acidicola TaxID=2724939 RepID=A0ABX1SJ58_9PSEU|nr:alpha/beta fold hydrolase [Pseudonocardia acidicola]NMI01586.1 S9 family peptidase [Pseudonocardia acidicola]